LKKAQFLKNCFIFWRLFMEAKSSRRQFFLRVGQMLGLAVVIPSVISSVVFAEERRRARPAEGGAAGAGAGGAGGAEKPKGDVNKPMVDPKSKMAQDLSYSLKHADVKKPELKTERQGVPFEKQFCKDCNFYQGAGKKNGTEVGNCTVLSGNNVPHDAWCSSWFKRG
jgi:hypothetical protein